jgi:hypothetical protein
MGQQQLHLLYFAFFSSVNQHSVSALPDEKCVRELLRIDTVYTTYNVFEVNVDVRMS